MKIAFLYNAFVHFGGIERIWTDKMNYLADNLHYDVFFITIYQGSHPYIYPLSENVKKIDLGIGHMELYKCSKVLELHEVWNAFMRGNQEVESLKDKTKRMLAKRHARKRAKMCDIVVKLTKDEKKEGLKVRQMVTIPNFTRFTTTQQSELTARRVISAGRLVFNKNYCDLIDAWRIVASRHPLWKLDIYGEGEQHDELQSQISCSRLDNIVTIHNTTNCIEKEFLSSSIYVSSSIVESFGLVLIKAMSCGVPCIAFDRPYGPAYIIKDREDGLIVENGNVEALADAICWMISMKRNEKIWGARQRRTSSVSAKIQ